MSKERSFIILQHETEGHDHGECVVITDVKDVWEDDKFLFLLCAEGLFRRYLVYWHGSPYGWERVQ